VEPEVRRTLMDSLAKALGVVALIAFGTGYWYLALPAAALAVLCVLRMRRWAHQEVEERARLAEAPTEEEQEAAPRWDEDGGISLGPRPDEDRPDAPR
jgi:hypothetical protein